MTQKDDKPNPKYWSEEKLLLHADQNNIHLTIESHQNVKNAYRQRLWRDYMAKLRAEAFDAMRVKKDKAREMYEQGIDTKQIVKQCQIPLKKLLTWVHNRARGEWRRPSEPVLEEPLPMHGPVALPDTLKPAEIATVSIVTTEDEDQLAAPVKELRREMRLMNLHGKQWAEVSFQDKVDALGMQVVGLAIRIVEKLKRMDDDELIDKEVVKTLVAMQGIKVNATPKVEGLQKPNGFLHAFVMNGEAVLPPRAKRANVVEIE